MGATCQLQRQLASGPVLACSQFLTTRLAPGRVCLCAVEAKALCYDCSERSKTVRPCDPQHSESKLPTPIALAEIAPKILLYQILQVQKGRPQEEKASGSNGPQMRFSERLLPMIRHVAEQVDGGSASHAADCKFFASELIMRGQRDGLSKFLEEALKDVGMFDFALTNMIFDETELEINLKSFGLGSWSILASHAQMTFCVNDQTHDFDFIRAPAALPNKQATTMWPALCAGEGGLWPGLPAVAARVRAVLVTCDAAPANIKLLSHLQSVLDQRTLLLPLLCLQHRTGNVIERVTKLLGVLTGSLSVAKTLRSGSVVKRHAGHVRDVLAENLQVFDRVPPGVVEEWAAGQACAKAIFKLVLQGRDDDKASGACQRFLDFFASPWTGPTAGEGSGQ